MLVQCRAGQPGSHHILVKTHGWSNNWDTSSADHILLTHRHLSGVLRSYQRVGWAFDIPESYVQEHQQWKVDNLPPLPAPVPKLRSGRFFNYTPSDSSLVALSAITRRTRQGIHYLRAP